jgi:siroheme synthase-like protein
MRFLPVGLDVRRQRCVVVGGGSVGTRKVHNLLRAGASVTLISPEISRALAADLPGEAFQWLREEYREEHLDGVFLAVAATDDPELNRRVVEACRLRGVLVCDASSRDRTQVIFGALLEEGEATVAVFTDGRDPTLSRRTRDRVASLLAESPGEGPGAGADREGGEGGTAPGTLGTTKPPPTKTTATGTDATPTAPTTATPTTATPTTATPTTATGTTAPTEEKDKQHPMLILIAHGSRTPEWRGSLENLTESVRSVDGSGPVRLAFMQFAGPTLPDVVKEGLEEGVREFRLLPLFMASAGHVDNDIRPLVADLRDRHPEARFHLMTPVGELPEFHRFLQDFAVP